ncbi:hypothetical protein GGF32_006988 [Allomyces javanicus]|nr:hypothetical protein GGF32_006988 [Allomyces javanicus]
MPRPWTHTFNLSSLDWKWSHLWNHLYSGEYISSENGKYHFVMEPSGDLALYDSWLWIPSNRLWCSNSAGKGAGAPYTLELNMERDSDHSLYIMDKSGKIVWDVGVKKEYELHCLTIEDDGRVILSDIFKSKIYYTFKSTVAPKEKCHGTFEETVLPYIRDAVTTTIKMQEAMLACKSGDAVADVLTKTVPALSLLLTTAETTTYAMLQDIVNHVAAGLVMQKDLVKAIDDTAGDFTVSSAKVNEFKKQVDQQWGLLREVETQRDRAEQAHNDAKAEYQRQVKKKKDLEIAALAMLWFPIVSAGLGIGVAVSTKDVENARAVLDARKNDEYQQRKRYDDMRARLAELESGQYDAQGKKKMAETHLDGLKGEMGELKKQRDQFSALQEFLHTKCTQIGLAAGTARILELETTGYISMMPLIRMLKELVTEVVATGLVDEQDAKTLKADMAKIEAAAEKIKQLKFEGSKSLEDFFAPSKNLDNFIPSYETDFF